MQKILRSTGRVILYLVGTLLLFTTCSKEEPDLTYRVTYSVNVSGIAEVQQISILTNMGFTEFFSGENNFVRAFKFQPGQTARMRVSGFVIDGSVQVRLKAVNAENEIDKEEPFFASGSSPESFEIFLEAELE